MSNISPLWKPDARLLESANIKKYMDWLFVKKGLYFNNYQELWSWSVTDIEGFWESLWVYFSIKKARLLPSVKCGEFYGDEVV